MTCPIYVLARLGIVINDHCKPPNNRVDFTYCHKSPMLTQSICRTMSVEAHYSSVSFTAMESLNRYGRDVQLQGTGQGKGFRVRR